MRRSTLLPIFLLIGHLGVPAAEPTGPLVKETTPIPLFNGSNLDGLHIFAEASVTNPAAGWKIEEGV
ncbi:MAG TPA: hypothetical protein VHO24_05235, partial [Opitutaceae bacterium]|nr:hypothetical protein [Opitutaceae bacterium]